MEHTSNAESRLKLDPLGSLWASAWGLFTEKFGTLMTIVGVPFVVSLVGAVIPTGTFSEAFFHTLFIIAGALLYIFAGIAVIYALQNNSDVGESYRKSVTYFWPFIWLSILSVFAVIGGLFMLLVPGIILSVQLIFSRYILILENRRGIDAMAESREYVKGYWWAILGRGFLLGIIVGALYVLIGGVATIGNYVFGQIVSLLISAISVPFVSAYFYIIYKNVKALKPSVAEKKSERRGFLIASAIVGLVAPILLFLLAILVAGFAVLHFFKSLPDEASGPGVVVIYPPDGPVGSEVTLYGIGLSATDTVLIDGLTSASLKNLPSDGKQITFSIPESVGPNCNPKQVCAEFLKLITPGEHQISVFANGTSSNAVSFTVDSGAK